MLRLCYSYSGEPVYLPRERFIVRPSVYAVIRNDAHVILVTNTISQRYYLPGGGVETGESLEEGLHREVKEETGITITDVHLMTTAEDFFYYDPTDTAYHALQFYYCASACSLDLSTCYQVDHGEDHPQWIPVASLRPDHFHAHGTRLYDLITANNDS
ncbi:MAG: NUDIX hydrolase [Desulfobulbaceae bacterium]|nr:NUDIX hydrolase [Desulfobulbaceae bacterium]